MSELMSNGLGGGLLGLGLAFLVAVALVPLGIRLAWRFGVVDHPVGNKIHARPTPLMGGAAMAASFLAVTLLFPRHWPNQALIGLLAGCALAALLGLADEVWSLPAWKHFLGQVGVVLVAIIVGFPVIQKVSNPLSTTVSLNRSGSISLATLLGFGHAPDNVANAVTLVAGILFTVFWIVGMMNTVNFLDGLDGLAGGVAAIAAPFLGLWGGHMAGRGDVTPGGEKRVFSP